MPLASSHQELIIEIEWVGRGREDWVLDAARAAAEDLHERLRNPGNNPARSLSGLRVRVRPATNEELL